MAMLVVGLGQTGQSILAYCARMGRKAIGFDTRADFDKTQVLSQWPAVPVYLSQLPEAIWTEVDTVAVSPGVDLRLPVLAPAHLLGLPVIGDIELFAREAKAPIIAITGSNAKSTVTTLVHEMINAAGKVAYIGGNIGVPALDLLGQARPDYYVLELSSFQLDITQQLPAKVATVLNISPDHIDRHGSLEAYQAAKERIFKHCEWAVRHRGTHYHTVFSQSLISFGLDEPQSGQYGVRAGHLAYGDTPLMPVKELSPGLFGAHNIENALSALAITHCLQLPIAPQLEVLRHFPGLPHRCQLVRTRHGVSWFNDSKGTNVGATLAALTGLGQVCAGKIILLAGGLGKGADFTELRPGVAQYVRASIVFGTDAALIQASLSGLPCYPVADMAAAVALAQGLAEPGDYVLLSPACASLDMFKHYAHRGEVFSACVQSLD